jgi:hypothetical protein
MQTVWRQPRTEDAITVKRCATNLLRPFLRGGLGVLVGPTTFQPSAARTEPRGVSAARTQVLAYCQSSASRIETLASA